MLDLGLTLMCLRALQADLEWKEGLLGFSFCTMNGGLMAMIVLSLVPARLLQTVASLNHGYWYLRSAEFLGQRLMETLLRMRIPGRHAVRGRRDRLSDLRVRPAPRLFARGGTAASGPGRQAVGIMSDACREHRDEPALPDDPNLPCSRS